ncbi:MAG TPA: chromate efflux transporter [Chitinophagaceae bacterium]|nr:chromate efflux transporter [Chitinophagaceae bacterium]
MDQTPRQIFLRFLRFGLLAWGGPVAQIAMIKKELVEDEKWVSKEQFNRALAVYQALPGPEAHELCVYFGMKAGGTWGGFLAGLGFMLPGFLLMLLFTWLYITLGLRSPTILMIFAGIHVAVVSLIVFAVYRIGKHALTNNALFLIALFSGIAFSAGVNFLILLLIAGLAYIGWQKKNVLLTGLLALLILFFTGLSVYKNGVHFKPKEREQETAAINKHSAPGSVFTTGLKCGLLTFGGAYTAIPFMREDAVVKNKWMTEDQFLDGIALSGILPAPLIIFSTFVGYFGAGWWGAILITIGIFLPAFSFTLIGHSVMEKLIANTALHNFLDGITAGVIGLIGVTAIQLLISTVNSPPAIIIFLLSLGMLIKYRSKYTAMLIIAAAGLFSLAWEYLF